MTPPADAQAGRDRLQDLISGAQDAEADRDRHRLEEAVLSTLARQQPGDPFCGTFGTAFLSGALVFSRADLQDIAQAVWALIGQGGIVADSILVRDRLADAQAVTDVVLTGILDGTKAVDVTVAGEYIRKLTALDRYRRADSVGRAYLAAVARAKTAGTDPDAAVAELLKDTLDLVYRKQITRDYAVEADDARGFLADLAARRVDGRAWLGLDTGFGHLNEVLNGLTEGVYILAGAPSTGKTTLAKQIADHVAQAEGVPVLFWSFEQSKEELRIKSLARLSSVDTRDIWKGRTSADIWPTVQDADAAYRNGAGRTLTIIEAGATDTVDAIRAAALLAKRRAGDRPVLLVLDYLQIIPPAKDAPDNIRERVDWNLSELRRLSRDLKSPILAVSSQNRESYRGNDTPTLAALKESGGIEYSADVVVCLWRDTDESDRLTTERKRKTVRVEANVLKNRNGELAKVRLDFTPAWALFEQAGKAESLSWSAALGK